MGYGSQFRGIAKATLTVIASYSYGNALTRKDGETPLFDGQGSERTVTNTAGAVQATLTLSAFGQTLASSGGSTSAYQYAATSRYRNDGDAGLSLVGCRYYDAQTGQFITRDTYLDQKPYAYCDADPVNGVDPDGHQGHPGPLPYPKGWPPVINFTGKLEASAAKAVGISASAENAYPIPAKKNWERLSEKKQRYFVGKWPLFVAFEDANP